VSRKKKKAPARSLKRKTMLKMVKKFNNGSLEKAE
jgi:hypothetical protein